MKYTAINIGPIITTLGMTKRPRELWSASYLFSHLMRCIVESLPEDRIISPATLNYSNIETDKTIGLYPDRVFVEGDINPENIAQSVNRFADEIGRAHV